MNSLHAQAMQLATLAKESAPALATADGGVKNAVLDFVCKRLAKSSKTLITANAKDLKAAKTNGLSPAMIDRLRIDKKRIESMIQGVQQVMTLPDPVGVVLDGSVRPNGLRLSRVRVPLGTVLIIFESRPNVTIDAAALCIKSGNAAVLRGGKEARYSNQALGKIVSAALKDAGLPAETVQVVKSIDRALVPELLAMENYIDVVVPRGGKGLIKTIMEHSKIPMIKHLDGICHVYVDAAADLEMAADIAVNAKVQRPGVCNAMETLLVHNDVAKQFLPVCMKKLRSKGVALVGDAQTVKLCKGIKIGKAIEDDWGMEYLELTLSVAVVKGIEHAIRHINNYGSHHTDAIVTRDVEAATRFKKGVDSSSVMVNASTRFSDGFEFGLGAEIGISTDKLHARGPVGLEGLTTYKWIVEGEGQIRS